MNNKESNGIDLTSIDLAKYVKPKPEPKILPSQTNEGPKRYFLVVCTISGLQCHSRERAYMMQVNLNKMPPDMAPENYALDRLIKDELREGEYISFARIGKKSYIREVALPCEMQLNPFGESYNKGGRI